mmetsp:Transcript_4474/g.13252  ORF Transcript_4474/g.13252 Transcript_4474/m.13252 type:complete len:203 (-) Transcript_4474:412-1020(-)
MLGPDRLQLDGDLVPRLYVRPEINVPKRTASDPPAESVLVAHAKLVLRQGKVPPLRAGGCPVTLLPPIRLAAAVLHNFGRRSLRLVLAAPHSFPCPSHRLLNSNQVVARLQKVCRHMQLALFTKKRETQRPDREKEREREAKAKQTLSSSSNRVESSLSFSPSPSPFQANRNRKRTRKCFVVVVVWFLFVSFRFLLFETKKE